MKRQYLLVALLVSMTSALAVIQTPAGEVNVDSGRIVVNGEKLYLTRQYDGKPFALRDTETLASNGKNPGIFLSIYSDKAAPSQSGYTPLTEHIIVIDATGDKVRRSNVLDTGIDFQWGDNNYVIFEGNAMYFGIYKRNCNENSCRTMTVPHRMQFIYRDGKLEENKGPWRGPAKPEIYIEPQGTDPCFNVNGVEECRDELEREKAAKRAKQKRKATPAVTAK